MGCDYNDFKKHIDVDKFNKMIAYTDSKSRALLGAFEKKNDLEKQKIAEKNARNSLQNERFRQTAMDIKRKMVEKHNETMDDLNQLYKMYTIQLKNEKNISELLDRINKENIILAKKALNAKNTILLSDRKTYYEYGENSSVNSTQAFLKNRYWMIIMILIVGIIITKRYTDTTLWLQIAAIALFPFVFIFLLSKLITFIYNNTKNVYLYE